MFQDIKTVPLSPSKGKAKEKLHWQTGWWDFQPLVERAHRQVNWSHSSVIFTAHPTQPLLTARHFSSSKQFVVPSPPPIISSPGAYEPPTAISVAPGDDWLFAYFPKRNGDGMGCLWKRGAEINNWIVKEFWGLAQGSGVVAASWLGTSREWVTDAISSASTRLPPRGPRTPVSSPTLLLVTEDNQVSVCYFRHYIPSMKVIRCPLGQTAMTLEGHPHPNEDKGSGSIKQCFKATIGLGYNESSILIATRSYCLPPSTNNSQINNTMSDEMIPQYPLEPQSMEWESWGEEPVINITHVQLKFNGTLMSLTAEPLPAIVNTSSSLTGLNFINIPPSSPSPDPQRPASPRKITGERGHFYLASTYLDFGDYSSPPKSDLILHTITRLPHVPNTNLNKPTWVSQKLAVRSFDPGVLGFIAPSTSLTASGQALVYAGIIETSGTFPTPPSSTKDASIGNIRVLNLPDLTDNENWEPSPISVATNRIGQDFPVNVVVSPNGMLVCTISSSMLPVQTSIQSLPKFKNARDPSDSSITPVATALASAILSRKTAADITHVLSLSSTSIDDVRDIFSRVGHILDNHQNGFPHPVILRLIGEIMVVYKKRASHTRDAAEKEQLEARWKTAHDMCSLAACNMAFEEAKEGETYDLDAVWQLIASSTWIVWFTERIMKECVLSCDMNNYDIKVESMESNNALTASDGPTLTPSLDTSILLHLTHPFALQNICVALGHVKQYRAYLGSLSARGENAQIARDVLVDLIDSSGVDFTALVTLLSTTVQNAQALNSDDCQKALASCQPVPAMRSHLSNVIKQVTQSTILNKSTLFIKPSDLIDGLARLSVTPRKNKDKDVVSKRMLVGNSPYLTCLRCDGRSEVGMDMKSGALSSRWRTWERIWAAQCICGGNWTSDSV